MTLIEFEGSDSVLVVGWVEDLSERTFPSKDRLGFIATDGTEYVLVPSRDIENLDSLSAQKLTVLGQIDLNDSPPHLTVFGYRIMPTLDPQDEAGPGRMARRRAFRKRAA